MPASCKSSSSRAVSNGMGLAAGSAARASVALSMTFSPNSVPMHELARSRRAVSLPRTALERDFPMAATGNLFADISPKGADEQLTELLRTPAVRIERIVSHGHASPPGFWYDQDLAEWVLLLAGGDPRVRGRSRTGPARAGRSRLDPGARAPSGGMERSGPPHHMAGGALW